LVYKNLPQMPLSEVVPRNRGVAQPGSVLRAGRRSRRFESSHPDQFRIKSFPVIFDVADVSFCVLSPISQVLGRVSREALWESS
jgi:hypothetical protein